MHLHGLQLCFRGCEASALFPYADELTGEDAHVLVCLLSLGWISLRAFGGLEDEGFGFSVGGFEHLDVAVELADVLADEGVAFSFLAQHMRGALGGRVSIRTHLLLGRGFPDETADGLHSGRVR